ncbi:flagellar hook-length control protein FliK [Colwellia sp. MB02u-6]|uniref:flagellar hook-length control protein FliK n=1 Tax=Colwellia sp. MB02u-6 TaxID=2759824 RepID=UPI0015F48C40|nr:flagellar hook-length control protein FliK [Colwellia sp. MB02u-6]MBA6326971.1 flagellar hook-length control protein FliK [Colwellia sp. MB02u-6]
MSQLNILSTDAGQNPDISGAKGGLSIKSQAKSNAFNDAMEQHYSRKKAEESEYNTEPYGNFVSKAAEQHQQALKSERLSKANEADDAEALPVSLPIDDADTRSAPKSYFGFQTQTEHQTQAQSGLATDLENDDAVDLLKMLSGAEQLLTKSTANNTAEGTVQDGVTSGSLQTTTAGTTPLKSEQGSIDDAELMAKQAGIKVLTEEGNAGLDKAQDVDQITNNRALQNSARDIEATQTHLVNQSTATVVTTSVTDKKLDVNQKTAVNEDLDKLASAVFEAQKISKTESEKLTPQVDKVASVFNQALVDQAKPITSAVELAAQQEQSFESGISQLTTNTLSTQKSFATVQTETIAIYRKDFADAVKDKVMVMINQKIQQVEIQLDPPEMGNIHVRVNLQNEQAAVQFVVQNQQAREALEQNMGKLRDMLAENGVDVGEANIEQREAKEQNDNGFDSQSNKGQKTQSAEDNFSENDNAMVNVLKASSTGIDYYA